MTTKFIGSIKKELVVTIGGGLVLYFVFGIGKGNTGDSYIVSFEGQKGGITAAKVEIANSPQRHLNQQFVDELNKRLPTDKQTKLEVSAIMGDAEAVQFANEIRRYLLSQVGALETSVHI